jgi:hypothetical protein
MIYKIFAILNICNFYAPELYRDVLTLLTRE